MPETSQPVFAQGRFLNAAAAAAGRLGRALSPERLIGPILDKEMRVSSRRRGHYVLRVAYVLCLTLYVALVWSETVGQFSTDSAAVAAAFMSGAGQRIVAGVLWFQFAATQLIALFMLARAIPEETDRGTLGALLCTPISSFQVVLGKLSSKLLQLVLLLAISLPLLAVVRVFGGVPWGAILAGLCVTLCSVVLVGSWAILLSTGKRGLLWIVIVTLFAYGFLSGLFLGFLGMFAKAGAPTSLWAWIGPVGGMLFVTEGMSGASASTPFQTWGFNCLLMLGGSLLLLGAAARRLPGLANQGADRARGPVRSRRDATARPAAVRGPAILWKDLRTFLPSTRGRAIAGCGGALTVLAFTYMPFATARHVEPLFHSFYIFLYLGVAMVVTALAASTAITVEKESRALPILLTAPITDTQVIRTKAAGVFYRALAGWGLLLLHLLLFAALGQVHPAAFLAFLLVAGYTGVFLTGLGLYVSSMVRSSSSAVVITVGVCLLLWAVLPALASSLPGREEDILDQAGFAAVAANPFAQVAGIVHAGIDDRISSTSFADLDVHLGGRDVKPAGGAAVVLLSFVGYVGTGLLLARRARTMMRRRLFA